MVREPRQLENPAISIRWTPPCRLRSPCGASRAACRDEGGRLAVEPDVTLGDVARLAGVHPSTASRALNETTRKLVKAATAERVLAAAT
ncbi:MAG: LacI family DNA-binding transcriptional regulator, partial [Acidimicrobiales bacterium]